MINGQEFTFKGKLYKFDRYFQYSNREEVLVSGYRWVKTKQKFSGVCLLIGRKSEIEKEEEKAS